MTNSGTGTTSTPAGSAKLDYAARDPVPLAERVWTWVWLGAWWTLIAVVALSVLLLGFLAFYWKYVNPAFLD